MNTDTASRDEEGTAAAARQVFTSVVRGDWAGVFGVVSPAAVRRRPSDVVRVVVAAIVLAGATASAQTVTGSERALYDLVVSLPDTFDGLFDFVYRAGTVVGVVLVLGAAVAARRPRLGISMVLAAGVAMLAAGGLDALVDLRASLDDADLDLGGVPTFPALRLAVTTAVLLAAAPHLTRPARRLANLLIGVTAFSALYLVDGLPVGVAAAVVAGWGSAALVHLVVGSPAGVPTAEQVRSSLATLGLEVHDLALRPQQTWGQTTFTARDPDEAPLEVWVVGRDAADAQLLSKAWRVLWYRGGQLAVPLTRQQQIERQAFLLFLAAQAGARVPTVVAVGTAGRRADALLVVRDPPGQSLAEVSSDDVGAGQVDDMWANLARLHSARIAHNALGPWAVEVTGTTTAFADLSSASTTSDDQAILLDRVALLVTTATVVGTEPAVAGAARALGPGGLAALLPLLEPAALPRDLRRELDDTKALLAELRRAGAERAGVEEPQLVPLRRVTWPQMGFAAATILGVYLLFGQLAEVDFEAIVERARWEWVAVTLVVSQLTQPASAVAILGTVERPLPLRPVVVLQFANAFTGLVGGSLANTALIVRFFQRQGLSPAVAVSSGVLNGVGSFAVQLMLVVSGLVFTSATFTTPQEGEDGGGGSIVAVAALVAVAVLALVVVLPGVRRKVVDQVRPHLRAALDNVRTVTSTPRKAMQIILGNLASQVLFALTLKVALNAFGADLPLPELIVINSFVTVLGGMAPVPGGMGVMEAGLIGGMTAAGIDQETAVAATFTARLCTTYLPPVWGWLALRWLGRHDYV